jgi:phosphopantothenoylcysteine synthetase/decarboxylase
MNEKHCIVLGITGCIAAYKGADLCSQLTQLGFDVHVIMTESAAKLVTPQTFLTLSRNPVTTSLWNIQDWRPEHIALAERAKLLVIAPCTANVIGKIANGIADDALTTFALAHTENIIIAPGMNPKMWSNPAVQNNVKNLRSRGVIIVGPASGHVACGNDGTGRMSDVADILKAIKKTLK